METRIQKPFLAFMLTVSLALVMLTACGAPAATPAAQSPAEATATLPGNAASPTGLPASPTSEGFVPPAPASGPVSYSRDIMPIFEATCIKCHGGDKTEKGLDMKTYAALLAGSERGAVIVPGDSEGSRLAQLVMNGKMPKRGPKLTAEQVQLIIDWINAGAQNN